jgi:hypothetical protein
VYFFTRDGVCVVAKAGKEFETLAENKLPMKGKVYGVAEVEGVLYPNGEPRSQSREVMCRRGQSPPVLASSCRSDCSLLMESSVVRV